MALAITSSTMLNKGGETGHPCLVPDLRGSDIAVRLSYIAITILKNVCIWSVEGINHEGVSNFTKCFPCIYCFVLLFS